MELACAYCNWSGTLEETVFEYNKEDKIEEYYCPKCGMFVWGEDVSSKNEKGQDDGN